jgi:hypothetical protein
MPAVTTHHADYLLPSQVSQAPTDPLRIARVLDREADFELQAGHIAAAERLSRQAASLRGWA